jgi:hypothetical protein
MRARSTKHLAPLRHVAVLAAVMAFPAAAAAGQGGGVDTVDELKSPPSPALLVLGLAASKVDRPEGVRAIVASIVAASKDTGFPRNYSVEVSPYWLGTPTLSFDEYYRNTARNLYRYLSTSVAMTPLEVIDPLGTTGTAIGIGVRTLALAGRPHPKLAELRAELATKQRALNALTSFQSRRPRLIELLQAAQAAASKSLVAELEGTTFDAIVDEMTKLELQAIKLEIEIGTLGPEKKADADKLREELKAVNAQQAGLGAKMMAAVQQSKAGEFLATGTVLQALSARLEPAQKAAVAGAEAAVREAALAIQDLDDQRIGPLLAIAGGTSIEIPGNRTSDIRLGRSAIWFTPGYRFLACTPKNGKAACTASVEVLGVARYQVDSTLEPSENTWELGTRVVWQPVVPFATSLEWLGRTEADDETGTRLVAVAEYAFTPTAHLYASFGRDFAEKGNRRNLVSTFGLNLGFGRQPILQPLVPRTGTTKLPLPFPIK